MAPSHRAPGPQQSDANDEQPPAAREELDVIRERMKTFEQDRQTARPADEVIDRLLRRHPGP